MIRVSKEENRDIMKELCVLQWMAPGMAGSSGLCVDPPVDLDLNASGGDTVIWITASTGESADSEDYHS